MSRTPLLLCPECKQKAIVTKTVRTHPLLSYRYCSCTDSECGLSFRVKEEFEKVLSPSAKGFNRLNDYLMKNGSHSQLALDMINPA